MRKTIWTIWTLSVLLAVPALGQAWSRTNLQPDGTAFYEFSADITSTGLKAKCGTVLVSWDRDTTAAGAIATATLYACPEAAGNLNKCKTVVDMQADFLAQPYMLGQFHKEDKVTYLRVDPTALPGGGTTALVTASCAKEFGGGGLGPGDDAADLAFDPTSAFWAGCVGPLVEVDAALECLAEDALKAVVTTQGAAPPVGNCVNTTGGQCLHFIVAAGVVTNIYCGIDGQAYGPCSPGFSAGAGTDSPNGNVSCEELVCLYSETDAGIVWVSWTPGDAGWKAVHTEPTFTRYRFIISNWASAAGARCLMHCTACAAYLCSAAGGTGSGFPIKTYSAPRSTARIRNISCEITAFTAPEADDNLEFQVVERDGSTAPVVATNKLTIAGNATIAGGVVFSQDLDDPLTLTDDDSSIELRIYSPNDAGEGSITDVDGYCTVMVEYGS